MAVVPALVCIAAGQFAVAIYAPTFTLSWEHSIEKVEWRETWRVGTATMQIVEARIKGTGAGMEPPPDAILDEGWYRYVPKSPPMERLVLPDSGFTKPMRFCLADEKCHTLRAFLPREAPRDEPVVLTLDMHGDCGGVPIPPLPEGYEKGPDPNRDDALPNRYEGPDAR